MLAYTAVDGLKLISREFGVDPIPVLADRNELSDWRRRRGAFAALRSLYGVLIGIVAHATAGLT